MRKRLFWTIAGTSIITGLLVLVGATVASQRAAVQATYRELFQSSREVLAIAGEALQRDAPRPGAPREMLRLLASERLQRPLARVRRSAGGSELAFAAMTADGMRSGSDLFDHIELDRETLAAGEPQFDRATTGELVVVNPARLELAGSQIVLLAAVAREAPVVRVGDQMGSLGLIALGIFVVAAVAARLLSEQLAGKLEPLSVTARRIAAGDTAARVSDLGDPVLDELGMTFNEMAAELEASEARERDFILGVGHELRTPLTTITGYAEALESGEVPSGDMERVGGVLLAQSGRLRRLIEDLSTLARLQQPEFGLRPEDVDVGAHVSEIAGALRRYADEAGVKLEVETEPGVVIETDPDRLAQVVQNLIENAFAFTPETGKIRVEVTAEEGGARLVVADTGVGIAPEELPHIFDRDYSGGRRRVRREGSGLGLSIVEGLVTAMGGEVTAESVPGEGTTITVRLPGAGDEMPG